MDQNPPKDQPKAPAPAPDSNSKGVFAPDRLFQQGRNRESQNLMNPVTITDSSATKEFSKAIVLDVLVVLFAGAFGYFFASYLVDGSFWLVLGSLFLWGTVSFLQGLLQKNTARRLGIIFLEVAAIAVFFYGYAYSASALAVAALLVFVVLFWGYFSVRRELQNTVLIRFFTASSQAIGKVTTAAILFGVIMYAALLASDGNFFVSKGGFNLAYGWAAGVAGSFYPTIPFTGAFGDFATGVARIELQNRSTFQALSPNDKALVIARSASEIMAAFPPNASGTVATALASQSTEDVFYRYLSTQAGILESRFDSFYIGVWVLAFFLVVRTVGIAAVWLGQVVALLFYELLLATGFMKVKEESSTKETIIYT